MGVRLSVAPCLDSALSPCLVSLQCKCQPIRKLFDALTNQKTAAKCEEAQCQGAKGHLLNANRQGSKHCTHAQGGCDWQGNQ